jgi:alpha-glucuronidase
MEFTARMTQYAITTDYSSQTIHIQQARFLFQKNLEFQTLANKRHATASACRLEELKGEEKKGKDVPVLNELSTTSRSRMRVKV